MPGPNGTAGCQRRSYGTSGQRVGGRNLGGDRASDSGGTRGDSEVVIGRTGAQGDLRQASSQATAQNAAEFKQRKRAVPPSADGIGVGRRRGLSGLGLRLQHAAQQFGLGLLPGFGEQGVLSADVRVAKNRRGGGRAPNGTHFDVSGSGFSFFCFAFLAEICVIDFVDLGRRG